VCGGLALVGDWSFWGKLKSGSLSACVTTHLPCGLVCIGLDRSRVEEPQMEAGKISGHKSFTC